VGLSHTTFSGALLSALHHGHGSLGPRLSLSELGDLVKEHIHETYPDTAVRPEVHSPDQREGDVADVPLFPNTSFLTQKAEAESQAREKAAAAEQERIARENAEAERRERERAQAAERERKAREQAEAERLEREKARVDTQAKEQHGRTEGTKPQHTSPQLVVARFLTKNELSVWLQWMLATSLGWAVGLPIAGLAVAAVYTFVEIPAVGGAVIAIAQWFVLQRKFDGSGWWILASALGWAVADVVIWHRVGLGHLRRHGRRGRGWANYRNSTDCAFSTSDF
jgi:hypothetical protein